MGVYHGKNPTREFGNPGHRDRIDAAARPPPIHLRNDECVRRRSSLGISATPVAAAEASGRGSGSVTIVEFSDVGKLTGKATVPRVVKSDAEWKQQLSPISYQVARHAGTERAYTGGWPSRGAGDHAETELLGWPSRLALSAARRVNDSVPGVAGRVPETRPDGVSVSPEGSGPTADQV